MPYVFIGYERLGSNLNRDIFPNSIEERITDEAGSFRIAGLFSGRYRLFISTISDRDTEWYSDDLTVDIAGEDFGGIELKAYPGASISGFITVEGAKDPQMIVTLARSTVLAYSRSSENLSGKSASYRIGANGRFRLPGLRAGEYALSVLWNGNPQSRLSMQRVEVAGQPVRDTIELKEGQSISDARIVMVFGDGVVRGQVKYQNGEPPKDSCFSIQTSRNGECLSCYRDFQSRVSAGGHYTLEGLPPGDYELRLYAVSCGDGISPAIQPVKQTIKVTNGAETRADFVVDLKRKDQ